LGPVFQQVFATAKPVIKGGHPHRFRDTFAVSLLLKGVSIEIVSKLLGHSSIKDTERHYSPWVKARQDQLETGGPQDLVSLGHIKRVIRSRDVLVQVRSRFKKQNSNRTATRSESGRACYRGCPRSCFSPLRLAGCSL
jgi:hypothetical protein